VPFRRTVRPQEEAKVKEGAQLTLVFFWSERSGPARRMESLLAHFARKERARLRVIRVDVDAQPELAERFRIDDVPTLVLVKGRRVVGRLEGRASAPKIESLLEPHFHRRRGLAEARQTGASASA
jgi:thioredoxin-like negative regulator of GroEL